MLFTCNKGNEKIVTRINWRYEDWFTGEDYDYATVQFPAGVQIVLVKIENCDAHIINMQSPAWHVDDQDD